MERETSQEERDRQDKELMEERAERRERMGQDPVDEELDNPRSEPERNTGSELSRALAPEPTLAPARESQ